MLTAVQAEKEVIFAELGSEISLLNIKTGMYYTLNSVGASIWSQIQQKTTLAGIKKELLDEFDVEEQKCELDLIRIVKEMHNHGLVEITSA